MEIKPPQLPVAAQTMWSVVVVVGDEQVSVVGRNDNAVGPIDFVRLAPGGLKVSTKQHMWVLRDKKGDFVAAGPCKKVLDTNPKYAEGGATIAVEVRPDGVERIDFQFVVPVDAGARGGVFEIPLEIELAKEQAGGDRWRMPAPKEK